MTFFVNDIDEFYTELTQKGVRPEADPQDTAYGERFFMVVDPDGHEIWYVDLGSLLFLISFLFVALPYQQQFREDLFKLDRSNQIG